MRVARGLSIGVGAGFRSAVGQALALTGGLYAVGRGGAYALRSASDLGEVINQTRVTFGESARGILLWSRGSSTALGLSRRAALEAAAGFGGILKTSKLTQREATGMSKRLVKLAADLASFKNETPEDTLEAIRSGLIGEAEPMRRFNVLLSEAAVKEEAYRAGIAARGAELDEAQKVQARYNLTSASRATRPTTSPRRRTRSRTGCGSSPGSARTSRPHLARRSSRRRRRSGRRSAESSTKRSASRRCGG
jgi:hypothetical protein